MAFLVLTIAGERLELTRFMLATRGQQPAFVAIVAVLLIALVATLAFEAQGLAPLAAALLALSAWLLRHDIARRTIRQQADALHRGLSAGGLRLARARGLLWPAGGFRLAAAGATRRCTRSSRLRVLDDLRPRAHHPAGGRAHQAALSPVFYRVAVVARLGCCCCASALACRERAGPIWFSALRQLAAMATVGAGAVRPRRARQRCARAGAESWQLPQLAG